MMTLYRVEDGVSGRIEFLETESIINLAGGWAERVEEESEDDIVHQVNTLENAISILESVNIWVESIDYSLHELDSNEIVEALEDLVHGRRLKKEEIIEDIALGLGIDTKEIELSDVKVSDLSGVDDYLNLCFTSNENNIYTLFILSTKAEDVFYISEIA